jgi:hypothetical protein
MRPRAPDGHCTNCPHGTPSAPTARQPKRPPARQPGSRPARTVGTCERHPGGQPLCPQDIAIGVAHRDQADQIRQAPAEAIPPAGGMIGVDTANRLQGAEFDVTIVLHPLSGWHDATAFYLARVSWLS